MDTAQWPQEVRLMKPMEEMVSNTCSRPIIDRKGRPQKEQVINCPRCNSTNTKFCYYNNYSLTQPRYFCKTCRRYWTEGGSLRNVPVGGGSRKKRSSSSSSSSSIISSTSGSSKKLPDLTLIPSSSQPSTQIPKTHEGQDLNLAFPHTQNYQNIPEFVQLPNIENHSSTATATSISAMELLSGITSRGLNSFMQDSSTVFPSGFASQGFKPTLNFSLDGLGGGYNGSFQSVQESGGRALFPYENLRQVSNTTEFEQTKGQGDSTGYWSGMLGGGSW